VAQRVGAHTGETRQFRRAQRRRLFKGLPFHHAGMMLRQAQCLTHPRLSRG
jgi:hypothetical protein